jgi:uncharacterized membrane protein YwzB
MVPSVLAHILNGLLFLVFAMYIFTHRQVLKRMSSYQLMVLFMLVTIAVSIHGISHAILEKQYNFNPLSFFQLA